MLFTYYKYLPYFDCKEGEAPPVDKDENSRANLPSPQDKSDFDKDTIYELENLVEEIDPFKGSDIDANILSPLYGAIAEQHKISENIKSLTSQSIADRAVTEQEIEQIKQLAKDNADIQNVDLINQQNKEQSPKSSPTNKNQEDSLSSSLYIPEEIVSQDNDKNYDNKDFRYNLNNLNKPEQQLDNFDAINLQALRIIIILCEQIKSSTSEIEQNAIQLISRLSGNNNFEINSSSSNAVRMQLRFLVRRCRIHHRKLSLIADHSLRIVRNTKNMRKL